MLCFCFRHNFNQFLCKSIFWSKPHSCPSPLFRAPPHLPLLNLMVLPLVSIPTNLMWLRATMLSLWDIWYDTNNKRRKELWFCLFYSVLFQAHNPETRQQNSATWVQIKSTSQPLHFYSPETPSKRSTLLCLYSDTNGSRWNKDIRWHEAHDKDDPIPHLSMEDGFHSRVTIQVVNLSQNRLTHVTGKLSATKSLTELRLGYNYFEENLPS